MAFPSVVLAVYGPGVTSGPAAPAAPAAIRTAARRDAVPPLGRAEPGHTPHRKHRSRENLSQIIGAYGTGSPSPRRAPENRRNDAAPPRARPARIDVPTAARSETHPRATPPACARAAPRALPTRVPRR